MSINYLFIHFGNESKVWWNFGRAIFLCTQIIIVNLDSLNIIIK